MMMWASTTMLTKENARTAGYSFHHHPSSFINGLGTSVTMTWTNGEAVAKRCDLNCHSADCGNRQSMVDKPRRRASIAISMERHTSVWDASEGGPASFRGRGVVHTRDARRSAHMKRDGYTRSRGIANRGEQTRAMTFAVLLVVGREPGPLNAAAPSWWSRFTSSFGEAIIWGVLLIISSAFPLTCRP